MKRITFTLWAAVFVAFSILHVPARSLGQNSNYLYLVPNTEDVAPLNNKTQKSAMINAIFEAYGVTDYRQSFPKAGNQRLSRVCEIHATGDITALYRELGASGLFNDIELQSYYRVACSSPVPFNDPFLYLGSPFGTWQLDMIEAGCAWSITPGDPNVWIGICDTEFRTDHEDFAGKFAYIWNPTSWVPNCMHGTAVSSAAAANVNNNIGVAGIGNQCKIAGYVVPTPTPCFGNPWPAIWQAYQDGTKVINVSWGGVGGPTSGTLIDAIKEITQNGSTMVVAAGNTSENFHSAYAEIPGVINVTAVNHENKVGPTGMAHNGWVDICTPGGGGLVARGDAVNAYSPSNSTSASAPVASGVIGLMLSVNPCLFPAQIEAIIKATGDPIADGNLYPGQYGGGKINAYQAVLAAQMMYNSGYDLFIQDTEADFGQEPSDDSYPFWNSKAIWLRNDDDGEDVHETVDPADGTAYVYVRVRNIGCQASPGTDKLHVSWAKAATNLGWPWPWNGLNQPATGPALGGLVDEVLIPSIPAGGEAIIKVEWNGVPDPADYPHTFSGTFFERGHFCLLARIVSTTDPMHFETTFGSNVLDANVRRNNNIAQRNISIMDEHNLSLGDVMVDHVLQPSRTRLHIGNIFGEPDRVFKLTLKVPENEAGSVITSDAEVRLKLDNITWDKWAAGGFTGSGIDIADAASHEILIGSNEASISNLFYASEEYSEVALGVKFHGKASSEKQLYGYDLIWSEDISGAVVGGEHFEITRPATATVSRPGGLTASNERTIEPTVSPNPASDLLNVRYPGIKEHAAISLYDNLGRKVQSDDLNQINTTIDISNLPAGIYFYQIINGKEMFNGKVIKK